MHNSHPAPANTAHGIDLYAPGGLAALFEFRRQQFGDAVMETDPAGAPPAAPATPPADPAGTPPADPPAGNPPATPPTPTPAPPVAPLPPAPANPPSTPPAEDEPLGAAGMNALREERDTNKTLRAEVTAKDTEIRDLTQSGTQKDALILRYQVAAAKGLDLNAAERLQGTTKEEIEADADTWARTWGTSNGPGVVPGAGARGETSAITTPGLGTLRAGYANSK